MVQQQEENECSIDRTRLREIIKEHRLLMKTIPELEKTLEQVGLSALKSVELGTKALEVASGVDGDMKGWIRVARVALFLCAAAIGILSWIANEKLETLHDVQKDIVSLQISSAKNDAERNRLLTAIETAANERSRILNNMERIFNEREHEKRRER